MICCIPAIDGSNLSSAFLATAEITHVSLPAMQLGRVASRLLNDKIEQGGSVPAQWLKGQIAFEHCSVRPP